MRSGSSALKHAVALFLVSWMAHCGNELVAAGPPGQSPSSRQKSVYRFFLLLHSVYQRIYVTLFQLLDDLQLAGTITLPTRT
jgi:hypothetical protein